MTNQPISVSQPLSSAWERMKNSLFRPFSLKTWFVLGFTAWLAGLAKGGGGGGGFGGRGVDREGFEVDSVGEAMSSMWERLVANSLLLGLAMFGCMVIIIVTLAVLWLSSRGKFMFLDNVVYNRAMVVVPWRRFARAGNSLFLFRLLFIAVSLILVVGLLLSVGATVGFSFWAESETLPAVMIGATGLALFGLLVLAIMYTAFFLEAFVVPLMHRYDVGVVEGWRRFLAIFAARPWPLLLCGLFVVVLGIGTGILVVATGLATCCIGFLFLMIPYIGSVIVLPISVLFRAFTFEFLTQFDDDLLPPAVPAATET